MLRRYRQASDYARPGRRRLVENCAPLLHWDRPAATGRAGFQGAHHVPLAGLYRESPANGERAVQGHALADRPEPACAHGRHHHQRRRFRPGLVRQAARTAVPLPQRASGLERPQPARGGARHPFAAVRGPHPRRHRHAGAGNQLPSVPPWQLAVRAQRRDPRLSAAAARSDADDRARVFRFIGGVDRFRGDVPAGADLRPGRRSAAGAGAHGGGRSRKPAGATAWRGRST